MEEERKKERNEGGRVTRLPHLFTSTRRRNRPTYRRPDDDIEPADDVTRRHLDEKKVRGREKEREKEREKGRGREWSGGASDPSLYLELRFP